MDPESRPGTSHPRDLMLGAKPWPTLNLPPEERCSFSVIPGFPPLSSLCPGQSCVWTLGRMSWAAQCCLSPVPFGGTCLEPVSPHSLNQEWVWWSNQTSAHYSPVHAEPSLGNRCIVCGVGGFLTSNTWSRHHSTACHSETEQCVPRPLCFMWPRCWQRGWSQRPTLTLSWMTSLASGYRLLTSCPCVTSEEDLWLGERIGIWGHDANSGAIASTGG